MLFVKVYTVKILLSSGWFIIIFIFPYRWNKYLPRSFFSSPLPVSIDTLGN